MFAGLPDDSKLWVFGLTERATPQQIDALKARLDLFMNEWKAHGAAVAGTYAVVEDRFVLVTADSRGATVSGCSIDSMFGAVNAAIGELGLQVADPSQIFYRGATGEIRSAARQEFKAMATAAGFNRNTPVFNPVLTSVGELRGSGLELPFEASWHSRAFR